MGIKHEYNTTYLNPEQTFNKHVFHRDQFAHYLRWTHVLKIAKIGQKILDYGSGTGQLLEVLYRNRYKQNLYVGLEFSRNQIKKCKEKYNNINWAKFYECDIIKNTDLMKTLGKFDIISSFEVIEHVNKKNVDAYFQNMKLFCHKETICLISTPIYDERVGHAKNHEINGIIQEFKYDELKEIIKRNGFEIHDTFGTFASQRDYKPIMNEWQKEMFKELSKYYDSNLISNIMAPFFPKQSRNCLWILKLRQNPHKTCTNIQIETPQETTDVIKTNSYINPCSNCRSLNIHEYNDCFFCLDCKKRDYKPNYKAPKNSKVYIDVMSGFTNKMSGNKGGRKRYFPGV